MRPRDTLTPEQERELEAIDRALAGEPVELELRELEELVLDIRATAPAPSPGFAARLEQEVREGFPAAGQQPARRRPARWPRTRRRWLLLPALGSLAAVLVALVVVLGARDSVDMARDPSSAPSAREPATTARDQAAPAPAAGGRALPAIAERARDEAGSGPGDVSTARRRAPNAAVTPAPPSSASARVPAPPPALDRARTPRKVERSASMSLQTPADEFDRTTDAVNATVARFAGIVASSQIGQSDGSGGEATYDLRIPTDRLDRALAALSKLGHVTERSQGLDDITGSFTSVQENLVDARAERRGLLRALARATTQAQIDGLKAQLRSVGSRIGGLKGRLASLRRRADLATVSLTIRGSGEGAQPGGGPWTPGDAAGDALRVLEVLAGVLLIGLAVLLPAGLLAALVALGVRLGRRRRREAALDPA
jgi:hypothetical protein